VVAAFRLEADVDGGISASDVYLWCWADFCWIWIKILSLGGLVCTISNTLIVTSRFLKRYSKA